MDDDVTVEFKAFLDFVVRCSESTDTGITQGMASSSLLQVPDCCIVEMGVDDILLARTVRSQDRFPEKDVSLLETLLGKDTEVLRARGSDGTRSQI